MLFEKGIQLYSFACGYPVAPAKFVEKTVLPPPPIESSRQLVEIS